MRGLPYLPFSIIGSFLAKLLGRRAFRATWAKIDAQPPPGPRDGTGTTARAVGGRALEAAVMAGSAALVDRQLARLFHYLVGYWPKKPRTPEGR